MFPLFDILIFGFVFILIFSYILYPALIWGISLFSRNSGHASHEYISLSILISAYNESKTIKERILNIAKQNYNLSYIEVLVGSDCSNDETAEILLDLEKYYPWLKVFVYNERRGKAMVINDLVNYAKNDFLVFTDANTVFDKNALANLVKGYTSSNIGGVSGRLILTEPKDNFDKSSQEKKYWEYETFIKKNEGKLGVLIGANGGIFSIRRQLFKEIPREKAVTDDLYISLSILSQGYKFVYQYDSFAYEEVARMVEDEYKRKIRFAATNFQTLLFFPDILFNKNILLSIAFWSHKVIRWFIPFLLVAVFLLSFWNPNSNTYVNYIFYLQAAFYTAALVGKLGSVYKIRLPLFSLAYFFVITNLALFLGFIRFLKGRHTVIWQSTPR